MAEERPGRMAVVRVDGYRPERLGGPYQQYTYVCLRRKLVLNGDWYDSAILGRLRRNVCRGWLALATVVDRTTC